MKSTAIDFSVFRELLFEFGNIGRQRIQLSGFVWWLNCNGSHSVQLHITHQESSQITEMLSHIKQKKGSTRNLWS
jgi:hypothetical protein